MNERIKTYEEFYTYYLSQHQNVGTRILHWVGTLTIFAVIAYVVVSGKERFLWYIPIFGYGLPLLSHYVFERNNPTFFRYPTWTLISDFRMAIELLSGKICFKNKLSKT